MPEADWLDTQLLAKMKDEVNNHPSRVKYMNSLRRGLRHYSASDEWWVPVSTLDDVDISSKHPNSRENIIRSSVLEVNSVLLKNNPMVITHPYRPEDADISDEMDKILMGAWRNAGTQYVLRSMQKESMICGLSVGKIGWNTANKKRGADGDVQLVRTVPGDLRLDPYAPNELRGEGIRYAVHTTRQTPESIIYRYEDEGAIALGIRSARGRKSDSISQYLEMIQSKIQPIIGREEKEGEKVDRRVPVDEVWMFPLTVKESDLAIGRLVDEKKYPYGLVATFINGRRVRLMPNPFISRRTVAVSLGPTEISSESHQVGHGMHPFVLLYWIREEDQEGYGGIYDCEGCVKHQIPIQHSYNSISRNIEINARTTGNPPFTYIEDALAIPEKRVTLGPGEGIPINAKYSQNHSDAIQFHPGREMPIYVHQLALQKKDAIKDEAGLKPGMIGLQPQGTSHTETEAIGTIQEASFSKMWTPTDELVACIGDIAMRYLGLIQQKYKPGRYVDVSAAGMTNFVKVQGHHISAQFSVEVISGTTTPLFDMHRAARQAEIKQHVDTAIASNNRDLMMSAVVYLRNLQYPYVHNWIQLLLKKIDELDMINQGLQGLGAMGIAGGLGQLQVPGGAAQAAPALGAGGAGDELDALAAELGVNREQLIAALQD
jgi:hypothetical protein